MYIYERPSDQRNWGRNMTTVSPVYATKRQNTEDIDFRERKTVLEKFQKTEPLTDKSNSF